MSRAYSTVCPAGAVCDACSRASPTKLDRAAAAQTRAAALRIGDTIAPPTGGMRARLRLIPAPEPPQRVGQDRAAVAVAEEPLAVLEAVVVAGERERFGEREVRERPVAVRVVEIVRAVLKEDANRLLR